MLNINTTNVDELLKKRNFDPIPAGLYTFEVANDLKIEKSKSSANQVVKLELVVQDEGDFRGRKVFDNLVICADPATRSKTDWKIAQFAVATGLYTKDTLDEIDLDAFKGAVLNAVVGVEASTNQITKEVKQKNKVKEYIFEEAE